MRAGIEQVIGAVLARQVVCGRRTSAASGGTVAAVVIGVHLQSVGDGVPARLGEDDLAAPVEARLGTVLRALTSD